MDALDVLGVTYAKLIAQVLLFLIVYAVLKKFAFGPVTAMLDERRIRIEEGEANLEKIKTDLEAAETRAQEIIDAANTKAERMVGDAKESAATIAEKGRQEAALEATQIIEKAGEAARLDQERMAADLKGEFGRLVVETTSKVTGKVLTAEDQDRISKETAGQIAL